MCIKVNECAQIKHVTSDLQLISLPIIHIKINSTNDQLYKSESLNRSRHKDLDLRFLNLEELGFWGNTIQNYEYKSKMHNIVFSIYK